MSRRGRKPPTVEGMRRGCRRCLERMERMFPGIELGDVGAEEVFALQDDLLKGYKESTARSYLEDFGGYLEWVTGVNGVRRSRLMWNGRADVERVWITPEDYRKLYRAATARERVMLSLGATMGLRREEIMTLTMPQIRNGSVEVHGKGHGPNGKVSPKETSSAVEEALRQWLPERERILREHGRETDRLIVSWCGKPMDKGTMSQTMKCLGERVGVKVTPHSLRRLYATTMADAGVDLDTMARMMRHASPSTTSAYYLREDPRRMRAAQSEVDSVLTVEYDII